VEGVSPRASPPATPFRAALHAATGVPRLYRAARHAGAGPVEAGRVLLTSAQVLLLVAPQAGGAPGRQNAVRHFVWQAALTARHGSMVARAVAAAQEEGSVDPLDSAADLRNNGVGQSYGAQHASRLAALPQRAALRELLEVGLARWRAGDLAATGRRGGERAARRRRRGWRGRATPRTPT
jgi:hypothetical protein